MVWLAALDRADGTAFSGCCCFDTYNEDKLPRRCNALVTAADIGVSNCSARQLSGFGQVVLDAGTPSACRRHLMAMLDRIHPQLTNKASISKRRRGDVQPLDMLSPAEATTKRCRVCAAIRCILFMSRVPSFFCPRHTFRVAGVLVALPCMTLHFVAAKSTTSK